MAEAATTTPPISDMDEPDAFFIGAIVCIAAGALFLTIGFIRLAIWGCHIRSENKQRKKRRRQLNHMRYLEEYSMKAGGSPNDVIINNNVRGDNDSVFKWDTSLVNMGYIGEDTLRRHSPKEPKLDAHINGSTSSYNQQRSRQHSGSSVNKSRANSSTSVIQFDVGDGTPNAEVMTRTVTSTSSHMSTISTQTPTSRPERQSISGDVQLSDRLADVPM